MLQELERKLAAVVAGAVEDRPHLTVSVAAGPLAAPAVGEAVARISVMSAAPDSGFERDRISFGAGDDGPTSRRVLPLRLVARIAFALRPATGAGGAASGRATLLEDISRVGHALDDESFRSGRGLRSGSDAGYEVQTFELAGVLVDPVHAPVDGGDDLMHGELGYHGRITIWPPGSEGPEGLTRAVDVTLASTPLGLAADDPVVRTGGSTRLRIRGVSGSRLVELGAGAAGPTREPLALALVVASDLPTGQRGRIIGGEAGATTGTRIIPIGSPETVVTYEAPAGDPGATRFELVEVRLATRERGPGVLLGSLAVGLEAGP